MTQTIRPLLALLALVCCLSAHADQQAYPQLKDVDGDPLPPGAIARLGSKRWRVSAEPKCITLSPDGNALLVSTSLMGTELLDARTGKRSLAVEGTHFGRGIMAPRAALSPDSRILAAVAEPATDKLVIRIYDVARRAMARDIAFKQRDGYEPELPADIKKVQAWSSQRNEYVSAFAFSPNGKVLAAAIRFTFKCFVNYETHHRFELDENSVHLWEAETGKRLFCIDAKSKEMLGLSFSPDGKGLTGVDASGVVRRWDTATGREVSRWQSWQAANCSSFSRDGKWLAIGYRGGVLICDTLTGRMRIRPGLAVAQPFRQVASVCFSPDGKLVGAAYGSSVDVWDVSSGLPVYSTSLSAGTIVSVAFTPDSSGFFTAHEDELVIRRWQLSSVGPSADINGHVNLVQHLGYTADGKHWVTATTDGIYRRWAMQNGAPVARGKDDEDRLEGEWLRSYGQAELLFCESWQSKAFRILHGWKKPRHRADNSHSTEKLLALTTMSVGGTRILDQGEIKKCPVLLVRDEISGRILRRFDFKPGESVSGALSPDGRLLVAAVLGKVRFINVDNDQERVYSFPTLRSYPELLISSVQFSPDGSRVLVIGNDDAVRILAVKEGTLIRKFDLLREDPLLSSDVDKRKPISGFAFSPDGKCLLMHVNDDLISVREIATGQEVRRIEREALSLSPDNRLVLEWMPWRSLLRLTEFYSGEVVCECISDAQLTNKWVFSPSGDQLATTLADTTVLIWDTSRKTKRNVPEGLSEATLKLLWQVLRACEASKAYPAIGRLIAEPDRSIPFLQQQIRPIAKVETATLKQWIIDLDAESFRAREAASERLAELGRVAEPAMRAALACEPRSAELRRRLKTLIHALEEKPGFLSAEELSHSRAIQVLEQIHSPEAIRLLQMLANGAEGAPRTCEATEALQRLRRIAARDSH
jgi:WD40 repeat protein